MKSTKPPPAPPPAGPSEPTTTASRRAQPMRQTRANPPRTNSGLGKSFSGGRDSLTGAPPVVPPHDQPIDIFPALMHFTDAITALPRELVRHFTLLKEVDAKVFAPEENLFQLVEAAMDAPMPEPTPPPAAAETTADNDTTTKGAGTSAATIAATVAATVTGFGYTPAAEEALAKPQVFSPLNLPRRQHFRQTALKMQEMLVSLEEKNHVISTANDALAKQLARIDDIWPHLEDEFSDEAKWGSTVHWAYPENRAGSKGGALAAAAAGGAAGAGAGGVGTFGAGGTQHHNHGGGGSGIGDRSRRDGVGQISAAAQQLADEAAARSDARKQAVQAKKNLKTQQQQQQQQQLQLQLQQQQQQQQQHQDSDFDEHGGKGGAEGGTTKKVHASGKSKKQPPTAGGDATPVFAPAVPGAALIGASAATVNGGNPPAKRRKVEKPAGAAAAAAAQNGAGSAALPERAMAGVFGANAPKQKAGSPRETPAPPDGQPKKRKALPTSNGQSKKSKTGAAASPSIASSPVMSSFADGKAPAQLGGITVATTAKPPSSKSKQSSTPTAESGRTKLPTSAPAKPNGIQTSDVEAGASAGVQKGVQDTVGTKDAAHQPVIKTEDDSPTAELAMADKAISAPPPSKKEVATKAEDSTGKGGTEPPHGIHTTVVTMVTTKSGRASKPSTPALATFAEAQARPRSGRNAESAPAGGAPGSSGTTTTTTTAPKRSHKKNAGSQHVVPNTPVPLPVQGGQSLQQQQHQSTAQQSQKGTSAESTPAPAPASARDGSGHAGHKAVSTSRDRGSERRDDGKNGADRGGSGSGDGSREDGSAGAGVAANTSSSSKRNRSGNKTAAADNDDDDEVDVDELRYCYCNGVSYGEMVACDSEDCAREWFHLECAGLKVAPKGAAKWYCEDCKKRLKMGDKKVNGR